MATALPLVSAVIPAYNAADTIERAIQSVRAQTYPHLEIVVSDDGSTDATPEVLGRQQDVTVVRQENRGPSGARNYGIRASRGEIVALLDADDEWLPEKTERQLAVLRQFERPALAFTDVIVCYLGGRPYVGRHSGSGKVTRQTVEGIIARRPFQLTGPSAMFPRCLFDALGGFDERLTNERDLWARAAVAGYPVVHLALPLYRSHRLPGSITTNPARNWDWNRELLEAWDPTSPGTIPQRQLAPGKYAEVRRICSLLFARRLALETGDRAAAQACLRFAARDAPLPLAARVAATAWLYTPGLVRLGDAARRRGLELRSRLMRRGQDQGQSPSSSAGDR